MTGPVPPGLALAPYDRAQLIVWAQGAYPEEACALVVGTGEPPVITRLVACANVAADRRRRFEVDPATRIRLEVALRGTPERVIGVWHSHPDGAAQPSETDASMIYEPDLIWLITAVTRRTDPVTRAFRPAARGFQEIQLDG